MAIWLPERDVWTRQSNERAVILPHARYELVTFQDAHEYGKGVATSLPTEAIVQGEKCWNMTGNDWFFKATSRLDGYPYFIIIRFLAVSTASNTFIASIGDAGGSNNRVQIDLNSGSFRAVIAGSTVVALSYSINTDRWYTFCVKSVASNSHKLFYDGQLVSSSTTTVTWPRTWDRVTVGSASSSIATEGNGTSDFSGYLSLFYATQHVVSDGEAAELSKNPWQIFE